MKIHWGTTKNLAKLCFYDEVGMSTKHGGDTVWSERGSRLPIRRMYGISFGQRLFIGVLLFDAADAGRYTYHLGQRDRR